MKSRALRSGRETAKSINPSTKVSNAATANNTRRNQTPDAAETAVLAAVGVKPEEFSDTLASCEFFDGISLHLTLVLRPTPTTNTDCWARRLKLTDPQKAALKNLIDASASAIASAKASLCAAKPDLSTTPGLVAFAEKTAEAKVASLKAVEPKLQAFYNSLDEKQKKAFDTGGRVGGILDWLRNKID